MQKRMRQFDDPCGDPMFACFAQMRFVILTRSKILTDRSDTEYANYWKIGFANIHMTSQLEEPQVLLMH